MNRPSAVSSRVIPPANSSGSARTAYHGSPSLAAAAVPESRTTSVAVSKLIPNAKPTRNSCLVWVMERIRRPKNRLMSPRACSCASSSASSYLPPRRLRARRTIPASTIRLSAAISHRKLADTAVPATPPTMANPEAGRTTVLNAAFAAKVMPTPASNTTLEWPSAKKKPLPSGRRPVAISLRVVLSMAAMWSASKAWRHPSVHAVSAAPIPTPRPL
jgi:hypothetical protein